MLAKGINWDSIGERVLSRYFFSSLLKIFPKNGGIRQQRGVLNSFYKLALEYREDSVVSSLEILDQLSLYHNGNLLNVDWFFTVCCNIHSIMVNRCSYSEALIVEEMLQDYLKMKS